MRVGLRSIAAALVLLAATAFADPFTGRYEIVSVADAGGVSVTGFIDFSSAPMGTTKFSLSSGFGVTGFEIRSVTPASTLVSSSFADLFFNFEIDFDAALGAAELNPVAPTVNSGVVWQVFGDLDGEGDSPDFIDLAAFAFPGGFGTNWRVRADDPSTFFSFVVRIDPAPPAWKLALVPEPGTLVLSGLAMAGVVWRRRKRKA